MTRSGAAESGWAIVPTELGPGWVEWFGDREVRLGLPGSPPPAGRPAPPPKAVASLVADLERYWAGRGELPDAAAFLPEDDGFQTAVYRVVANIPRGSTLTYAEVARRAGRPGAARAVGAAMAANQLAPVVPCHRVVGSDGSLRGYAGGLPMKRRLLEIEGAHAR